MTFELKGRHVLGLLLAFFGVTIAVNAVFATYAVSTFSGEDVSKPYLRGLDYNTTIAERAAQQGLGWSAEIGAVRGPQTDVTVSVRIVGHDGVPKDDLKVEAKLRRPTDASLDRTFAVDAAGKGTYRAVQNGVSPGQWDVIARATSANGDVFEAQRRVVLP